MSAFIVSNAHISALASYANREMADYQMPPIEDIARELHKENVDSVNYRYAHHTPQPYSFRFHYPTVRRVFSPIEIVKACHCLAYQSCEHPAWEASKAKAILDKIESHAIRDVPGYREAAWGIAPTTAVALENRAAKKTEKVS